MYKLIGLSCFAIFLCVIGFKFRSLLFVLSFAILQGPIFVVVEDDFGATCVLADIDLCFSDDSWVIRNSTPAFCGF